MMPRKSKKLTLWFRETSIKDVPLVGGKNASLGEMIKTLSKKGMNIPDGFAVTAQAYFYFLQKNKLKKQIKEVLKDINVENINNLQERGGKVRSLILGGELPQDLKKEIIKKYKALSKKYDRERVDVAVRSSATAEDLPQASFAGQQETFLNIVGEEHLLEAVKKCFASLFTDRAIAYREEMKFDHLKIGLSVGVQKMVRSDLGTAGVMFSCDTESGFADVVLINASYGLGENVVKGKVEPDQYYVFETTLKTGFQPILEKKLGSKEYRMIYNKDPNRPTKNIKTSKKEREKFALREDEILKLAQWSLLIEGHYKKAMDTEWAKDGRTGELFIVQSRPETVKSQKSLNTLEEYVLERRPKKLLITGLSVGSRIGQGKINRIMNVRDIKNFQKGEVLVTDMTDPDWVPAMKLASAIVTDSGGRTAHAAIVSRELGVPCIVGTGRATRVLKAGQAVTVSCAEGEEGKVYEGIIPFKIKKTNIGKIKRPKTKVMMNLGEPDQAFRYSFIPNDGVGLAREEFIIANNIKVHPLALIGYKNLPSGLKKKIDKLTVGYSNKTKFFVEKLSEGIGKIGAAFYPNPVIIRFSDFKSNEYAELVGGKSFEPKEENPMLGWRGASRYYDPKFKKAFLLECQALKIAREKFGLKNIWAMVPFCRTPEEGKKVLSIMREGGLVKGKDGLKVIVMAEIPSNIILADKFLEIFDGMSIGSNDLAQLVLGIDRDSPLLRGVGDERNEAVKEMVREVIKACHRKKKYVGICGQAPSDYPEFAQFLVKERIDSISLNPDTVIKTTLLINKSEKRR